jgi:hypothetical protein
VNAPSPDPISRIGRANVWPRRTFSSKYRQYDCEGQWYAATGSQIGIQCIIPTRATRFTDDHKPSVRRGSPLSSSSR